MPPVLLLLLLLLPTFPTPTLPVSPDGLLLLKAKSSLDDPDGSLANWNPLDPTPCNWTGVLCSATPASSVTSLDISDLNLSGPFPSPLCLLPDLRHLSLSNNNINSTLDHLSSRCTSLTHLDLSYNLLVGPIPSSLPLLLPSLLHLDLTGNNLSGPIPPSLSLFPRLQNLSLVNNLLEGTIPPSLSNLSTTLRQLNLSYNPFSPGPIPASLGNLSRLDTLWLARCNLVGRIPPYLGNLRALRNLDLSYNNLSGPIPDTLSALRDAFQIELYANSLTGAVPEGFSNLTSLRNLDASMNQLSGRIPPGMFRLPFLESLNLYQNELEGGIPAEAAGAAGLVELRLFGNRFAGPVPGGLGSNASLVVVDLSQNRLSGRIPPGICRSGRLEELMLIDNALTGGIPEGLGGCRSLRRLRLSSNRLSGGVPRGLWGLPRLYLLDLAGNALSGAIPPEIAGGANLSSVLISGNAFSSGIPPEVGKLSRLYELSAAGNRLSGPLPRPLGSLPRLGKLDLHNNSLSGALLPPATGSWDRLTDLNLAGNRFTGRIPPELGDLPVLNYLDLSNNLLAGEIPAQLQNLTLNYLNLSNNDLAGPIPPLFASGSFAGSFLGNPRLCGAVCPAAPPRPARGGTHEHLRVLRWSVFALAGLAIAAGAAWVVVRYRKLRKERRELENSRWTLTSFHKLGFSEYEILDCLDEDNVIGTGASGKVYKAVLGNGETVAVKKLWGQWKEEEEEEEEGEGDRGGGDKGFEAEVATLGRIRHKNIVKLWCCCAHGDRKLLVYEYMPNGSLGDLLHSGKAGVLTWQLRHKIALDAAEGLLYLHHDCVPPIVHRDVKSNNILLDADFGARVADFGVAKVVESAAAGKNPDSMSVIAGSCGYIAPEYAYTLRVTEKSDIYSFGVVLMELVTGRPPVDPEFGEKDLVKWVCATLEQKGVQHVLDPRLDRRYGREICGMLEVALQCSSSLPMNRPSMRRVVKMLLDVGGPMERKLGEGEGEEGKLSCYYNGDNSSKHGSVA